MLTLYELIPAEFSTGVFTDTICFRYFFIGVLMKKLLTILLVLVMILTGASASSPTFRFVFGDLDQHPEILIGFCPTYLLLGFGADFHFIEDNTSEFQVLVGGGYNQRMVFQDPSDGTPFYTVSDGRGITYDAAQGDLFLRFNQGFMNDLLVLRASIETQYEANLNSFVKNSATLNSQLNGEGVFNNAIYPDLKGDHQFLGTSISLRLTYDDMEDTLFTNDGILAYVETKFAPYFLNQWLDGTANYYSLTANAVFAKTLYNYSTENSDWFSIVLIDRVNVNWTDGSVPVNAQGPVSLGRKVRGYNTYSYGTEFSVVNNFDIRFSGPAIGLDGLRPRINLFFDMGLGAGNYFNTSKKPDGVNFLCSTGGQITISIFDFIDLGYEVAYIFTGEKLTKPGDRVVTRFTFFLDF